MTLKQIIIYFMLIAFLQLNQNCANAGQSIDKIYVYPEIKNPQFADESIDLIQCIQEKLGLSWEVLAEPTLIQQFPRLDLKEKGDVLLSTLHGNANTTKTLGEFPLKNLAINLCKKLEQEFKQTEIANSEQTKPIDIKPGIAPSTATPTMPWHDLLAEKEEKSWLGKNWPWLALASAAIGTSIYLVAKNKNSEGPITTNRTISVQYK